MKPAPPVTTVFTESPPGLTLPAGARLDASTTGVPSPRTYAQARWMMQRVVLLVALACGSTARAAAQRAEAKRLLNPESASPKSPKSPSDNDVDCVRDR